MDSSLAPAQPSAPKSAKAFTLAPRQMDLFSARPVTVREPVQVLAPAPVAVVPPRVPVVVPSAEPVPAQQRPSREEAILKADVLARALAKRVGVPVRLAVHDNRSTMVSFKRLARGVVIRVHHMFLDAPPEVVEGIAKYCTGQRKLGARVLDDFIHGAEKRIRQVRRSPAELKPRGRCFDLTEIMAALNVKFFQDGVRAAIGWGRPVTKRRRKSIRLGVYDHHAREIRIHPALDAPDVPRFFVEYIVFHEMLHQLFPSARHNGKHVHHPRAFRDREKAFPEYQASLRWEADHLAALLRR